MRESGRRRCPRKLSALTSDELGIGIQQQRRGLSRTSLSVEKGDALPTDDVAVGYSSVEDAAAPVLAQERRMGVIVGTFTPRTVGPTFGTPQNVSRRVRATSRWGVGA